MTYPAICGVVFAVIGQIPSTFEPASRPGEGAGTLFSAIWPIIIIALTAKTTKKIGANRKCVHGLLLVCVAWLVIVVTGTVMKALGANALRLVMIGVVLTMLAAGCVLAVQGLIEIRKDRATYPIGRKHGTWALVIAGLMGGGMLLGFIRGRNALPQSLNPRKVASSEVFRFEQKNFTVNAPGSPWVQIDIQKLNPHATVGFMRANPQVWFVIIAENSGIELDLNTEQLADIAKANLRSAAQSMRVVSEKKVRVGALDALRVESESRIGGIDIVHVNSMIAQNGYAYQLITWAQANNAAEVRAASDRLARGFSLIDPYRVATTAESLSDFVSEKYGYSVKLAGAGWGRWAKLADDVPSADFGALHRKLGTLAVIPICLLGKDPHPDAVLKAFLARVNISYPGGEITALNPISEGSFTGHTVTVEREVQGKTYLYLSKILKGNGFAYLVISWNAKDSGTTVADLQTALDRVSFSSPAPAELPKPAQFNARESLAHARVLNGLGLYYYDAKQHQESLDYFRLATELDPSEPIYAGNVVNALINLGRNPDALAFLEAHSTMVATNQGLLANRALLQSETGAIEEALHTYVTLFSTGYRDESALTTYVNLLKEKSGADAALAVVTEYLTRKDSVNVRLLQASLHAQKREFDRAIETLQELQRKYPFNSEVAYALIDDYHESGRDHESLAQCQQLLSNKLDSAYAYFLKGRSEYNLKWYREAKASFEIAARKSPTDTRIKEYLDQVSGLLGEGNNASIKEYIAPVPVPATVFVEQPDDEDQAQKDYSAHYLHRVTALSYIKTNEFKTTTYLRAHVHNANGVTAFSTMQFSFSPLTEMIYVNELTVRDPSGHLVSTGNVSNCYVIDDSSDQTANSRKLLNIPIPGLQPGCRIDLTVTRRDLLPPDEFPYTSYTFAGRLPITRETVLVRGDVASVKCHFTGDIVVTQDNNMQSWQYNHPPLYRWEPLQQPLELYLPTLYLADSGATWKNMVKTYLGKIRDRLVLDDEVRALAVRRTNGLDSITEKVDACARYVQSALTYKAIEFGRRASVPDKVSDILRNRYGDCKDHALLLHQLLETIGVRSSLGLVNLIATVQKDMPSLDQFTHMILFVPDYKGGRFFDGTDKDSDLSWTVPYGLANQEVLILDENAPRFVRIPDYPPDSNRISSERGFHLVAPSDAAIEESVTFTGYYASWLRGRLRSVESDRRAEYVGQLLSGDNHSVQVEKCAVDGLDDVSQSLVLRLTYRVRNHFRRAGSDLLGSIPALWERYLIKMEPIQNRQSPFHFTFPLAVRSVVTFEPPDGYRLPALTANAPDLDKQFATSVITAEAQGSVERIRYEFRRWSGRYSTESYAACWETMQKAMTTIEQPIQFTKIAP